MAEGDLAYRLAEEQKRLAKLWDAYESQEHELKQALKKIAVLEAKVKEKRRINESLRELAEVRDREIRDSELELNSLRRENEEYRPRIDELEEMVKNERKRYSKLFAITQELEEELNLIHLQLEARDRWFEEYIGPLRDLTRALDEREAMIEDAERKEGERTALPAKPKFSVVSPSKQQSEGKESESKSRSGSRSKPGHPSPPTRTKEDIVTLFMTVPVVDQNLAEALYINGFSTLRELRGASVKELVRVPGVNTKKAQEIQEYLIETPANIA